jgi:hypothetical protein
MTTLREAAQQALEALEGVFESDEKGAQYWTVTGGTYEAVECKQAIAALKDALEQPEQEPGWRLSCGCPSHHGGIPAEWPAATREGDTATAYGVVCERHWHEYEARCPNCASLEAQNTELDKKLEELSERTLTDEVIADLWHQNGGFHHHFARAVERWLKGKNHA